MRLKSLKMISGKSIWREKLYEGAAPGYSRGRNGHRGQLADRRLNRQGKLDGVLVREDRAGVLPHLAENFLPLPILVIVEDEGMDDEGLDIHDHAGHELDDFELADKLTFEDSPQKELASTPGDGDKLGAHKVIMITQARASAGEEVLNGEPISASFPYLMTLLVSMAGYNLGHFDTLKWVGVHGYLRL